MKAEGKDYRTGWMEGNTVCLIEKTLVPLDFKIFSDEIY